VDPFPRGHELETATRAELERVERLMTFAGAQALIMARHVDAAPLGSTIAATLMKEFDRLIEKAMVGAEKAQSDIVDEIRARAARKLTSA
jgi:hypothetical protein